MPAIDRYDYQRPPELPDGVHMTLYFFPAKKKTTSLYPKAAWNDGP